VMHRQLVVQNRQLLNEVAVRHQAEAELSRARDALEQQVEQRTRQLAESNARLSAQVDERRRAEAKLQASEARFRTIVETSPIPLCITSMPEGVILYANEPLRELFGIDTGIGTLTNIVNSGTISAGTTVLNNGRQIARAIQEGAAAYLTRQYRTIAIVATATIAPLAGVETLGDFIINASIYGEDGRLAGAILVAGLALVLEGLLALLQRRLTSDGLKLQTA